MSNVVPFKAKAPKLHVDIYIEVSEAVVHGLLMYEATVMEQASDFPVKIPVATFRLFSEQGARSVAELFINSHYKALK